MIPVGEIIGWCHLIVLLAGAGMHDEYLMGFSGVCMAIMPHLWSVWCFVTLFPHGVFLWCVGLVWGTVFCVFYVFYI
jgi:hypothetical protein